MSLNKRTYVDQETVITAENLNDIQDEIILNGQNIGKHAGVFAPPYELDVSSALKAGKNHIEFRLETSPRNTLGPFHTNETEPQSTSPGSFLTERDLLGWYPATDVPEYGVLEPSP